MMVMMVMVAAQVGQSGGQVEARDGVEAARGVALHVRYLVADEALVEVE